MLLSGRKKITAELKKKGVGVKYTYHYLKTEIRQDHKIKKNSQYDEQIRYFWKQQ